MKTFFLLLLTLVLSKGSFAQKGFFSLTELEKLSKYNFDDFDTYVTNKGYLYSKDESSNDFTGKSYSFGESTSGKAQKFITLLNPFFNYSSCISFQTLVQSEYKKIKASIKTKGYKFIKTSTLNNGDSVFEYKKGKVEIKIAIKKDIDSNGNTINGYEITLINSQ